MLIAGGNSDAVVFERLAAALAAHYRVVSYDPRGNSRSLLDGPPVDQRVEVHAEDACRLLEHVAVAGETAQVFGSCAGGLVELAAFFNGRPAPVLPEEHDNTAFFLAHTVRSFTRFVPDLTSLAMVAERVVIAGGRESRTQLVHRPAVVLAELLGQQLVEFPGGHVGYAKWPAEFAERLITVLAAMPGDRTVPVAPRTQD